jgi:hypothetical protein
VLCFEVAGAKRCNTICIETSIRTLVYVVQHYLIPAVVNKCGCRKTPQKLNSIVRSLPAGYGNIAGEGREECAAQPSPVNIIHSVNLTDFVNVVNFVDLQ